MSEMTMDEAKELIRKAHASEHRLMEEVTRLRAALKPFAEFGKALNAMPLRGLDDEFYMIHSGTEWESSLRLSDCRAALKTLEETWARR